ncbi:MAG: hemerythrin domain-containing protein [Comamonadaceae bacterium]|uniref:hemerythrin domain-containing protein n=1 Tax=Candidatus Skiveiella danica TaxID=3386177 RepID=UPI00390B2F4A|nr:hemerythrin domain-containing protein [Comamonadaceae bacterium]
MPPKITAQARALIEHIQMRYHEGHRRALPDLLALAAAAEEHGVGDGLAKALAAIGHALEQHMFKEEMRLFPMMEQGGNTLIGRLIEDLHREHVDHEAAMNELRARLRLLNGTYCTDPALQKLIRGVDDLAHELAQHIRAEDEELFPLFSAPHAPASNAAFHP